MKVFRILIICLTGIATVATSSCKKTSKEMLEKISVETVEKLAKESSQEGAEKTLKSITKKEIRSLDWKDFLKIISKENINLAEAISKLDSSFQKQIAKAIKNDYDFYSALISSNTIVDEFIIFTKYAPKATDNIDLFRHFVKCKDLERRFGINNAFGNVAIKEESGIVKFFNTGDNSLIGELRDAIFLIKEPFKAGSNLIDNSSILKKTLIPNSIYKIKGANGLTYLYHVDDLGRFSKIEAKCINAKELTSNVIFAKENFNLGSEWMAMLKKISQTSKGNDIDATLVLKYADDASTPLAVKAEVKANNKKIVSRSFENLDHSSKKLITTADNASLLDKFASKTGLSVEKKGALLKEMSEDEELSKLIQANPELNIKRWLNTRNHVDKNMLARDGNGVVKNGRVYAGNVYYFNPHLNSGLKARIEKKGFAELKKFGKLSYEDLIRLDKIYPEGVPFTKQGYPDFTKVAFKDNKGKPLKINIGYLSGDSKTDISKARKMAAELGYPELEGYTWHHIENTTELIRVPSAIHQLVDHSGGMSTHAAQQVMTKAA